jgi:excisionase family DNA binding protein
MPEQLMTLEEARERLRIGRTKVYSMATSGELRTVRLGRSLRVREAEIERLIRSREQGDVTVGA